MELSVLNIKGKETGRKVKLNPSVFGIDPNDHAIYLDVKQHLANKRQGTHKSKERAEIVGSTRKIKKQKGTGTARAGSIKSPYLSWWRPNLWPNPQGLQPESQQKSQKTGPKICIEHQGQRKVYFDR
jgi:large subunit ribosomal protein L4